MQLPKIANMELVKENTWTGILGILILITIGGMLFYFLYKKNLASIQCNSLDNKYESLNGKIRSITSKDPKCQYTLKDYFIKSAYNCCSLGKYKNDYVGLCILRNIIKQGTRCLDIEVFTIDNEPVVATSTSDSYYIKETYNSIPLADVLDTIYNYAFASGTSPNPEDPLILHIRFKTQQDDTFTKTANLLSTYSNRLLGNSYSFAYNGKNLGDANLLDLKGKIILAVDKSNKAFMDNKKFFEYVNILSNAEYMRELRVYDVIYSPDMNELVNYNKYNMTIVLPDRGTNPANPDFEKIQDSGSQMVAMKYQTIDDNLEKINYIFDDIGYAFVLKPEELRRIGK